jgi:Arc/MetJ family transcription regulator
MEVAMTKTLLDLDEDVLREAGVALGTATKKDTVTRALQTAIEARRAGRRRTLADLQRVADEGGFDFDLYDELDK